MSLFKSKDLKREMILNRDAAYRTRNPQTPIQPMFIFRPAQGSDTSRPEANRQVLDRPSRIPGNQPVESTMSYWATGGTKKMCKD